MENKGASAGKPPRRLWPIVLVLAVALGVVLAVAWVRAEARRVQEQRQLQMPSSR
jgi:hypothetical protein